MFLSSLVLGILLSGPQVQPLPARPAVLQEGLVKAKYLITVADDFIVEVYHNGKNVPLSRRNLLEERFGATVERIDIEVKKGDWLVFNVVNNRLRWGGASYFAVAGCFAKDEFGFTSELDSGNWAGCDTSSDVDRFISDKAFFRHRPAQPIAQPWSDGDGLMRQYAGASWQGVPLWGGASRNTWVKVLVE